MKQLFIFLSLFCAALAHAQTITIVADSLRLPLGLEIAANGDILVTESGYGFNDGAVSIIKPDGTLLPLIVGLPSIFDTTSQEAVGPWRSIIMANNQLGVLSPLDGGILVYDLTGFVPGITPPISGASPTSQIIISDFVNSNQPPTMPDSNPYSVAFDEDGNLYIVDSGFNGIIKVDATTGVRSVFAVFPKWPNPLPFGPPEVDPVPTRIINKPGGGFLVCTLTGFPFQEGSAGVYTVDMNGSISNYAGGLTLLTDMALDANTGDLYVLQFGIFVLDPVMPGFAPNSAKITRIKPDGAQQTVAQNFGPAAGIALTPDGDLYISGIFDGTVMKLANATTGFNDRRNLHFDHLKLSPNPSAGPVNLEITLEKSATVQVQVLNAAGQIVAAYPPETYFAGKHVLNLDVSKQPQGVYFVELNVNGDRLTRKLIIR